MSTFEQGVYSKLSGTSAIRAIVDYRIYPLVLPQKESLPAITYRIVTNMPVHAMISDATLTGYRLQISCWGETYLSAKSIADAVKTALRDDLNATWGAVTVQRCFFDNELDLYEPAEGDFTAAYHIPIDFIVWAEVK